MAEAGLLVRENPMTNVEYISGVVSGSDCVLAFETAADFLGINNGIAWHRPSLFVYSLQPIELDGVQCIVLDSYEALEIQEIGGIRCTSVRQTIFDLLRYDRDDQVILESLADWYFDHNESYEGLDVPEDIRSIFDSYADDAIHYYDC